MACAGYLVRNNTTVVYAEILNGTLVCTPAPQHRASLPVVEDLDKTNLPLLALKCMERSPSSPMPKIKHHTFTQQEDEPTTYEAPRIVQLSGHAVDIVDCAQEDDSVVALLPFSFRVKTKKVKVHEDAGVSYTPADTLLLAAVDQSTKDEWMKRLGRWSRYGWHDSTLLSATEDDAQLLELALQRWRESDASSLVKPADLVFGYAAIATRATTRRRFYRHSGSFYAPINTTCPYEDHVWLQNRGGVKTRCI